MGTEIVRAEQVLPSTTLDIWRDVADLAKSIANTDFVPKAMRNNPAAVTAAILTGAELGLPPMASLSKIFIIDGRPGLYAEAMRALILSKGHEIWPDDEVYTTTRVRLWARRQGTDRVVKVEWNMDMAKAAGLAGKATWRAYPRSLLLARCTGELGRLVFADVLGGVSYTVEELEDGFLNGPAATDVVGPEMDAPKPITRKAAPAKKTAAIRTEAVPKAPPAEPPLPALPGEDSGDGEEQAKKRASMIAMKCNEAGLDADGRHNLIAAVTNNVKDSARTVTAEEGADVLAAVVDIKAGRKALLSGESGWVLVEVEDATTGDGDPFDDPDHEPVPEADITAPAEWDSDTWRQYLATKGVTKVELLREAHRLCAENEEYGPAPGAVGDLAGRESLCGVLVGFVEDNADPNREVD